MINDAVIFSLLESMTQINFSDRNVFFIRRRCRRRCCNLFTFSYSEPPGQFQPNLEQDIWVQGIQVCLNQGPNPIPRGDDNDLAKNELKKLKFLINMSQYILG